MSQISFIGNFIPKIADAAVVAIDTTVGASATAHLFAGSQSVFISDQVGYKFYVDSTGACVYNKTTNGGTSWGTQVTVDAQTDCFAIAVWYDQWTTGDYGSYIHIATVDTSQSSLWYNRLDTNGDTLLAGTAPTSTSLSLTPQANYVSWCK